MFSVTISIEKGEDFPEELLANTVQFLNLKSAEIVFLILEEKLYALEGFSVPDHVTRELDLLPELREYYFNSCTPATPASKSQAS